MVIAREGEDPEPKPGKDQRELASLFPKEVHSVSADRLVLLAVIQMVLVSARQSLDFLPSPVEAPDGGG